MSVPETNNLSAAQQSVPKKPKVLIVGAGLGGLLLGILLMKGGVDFEIVERAREVKPIGSAMSMGACFAQLFKQIGIFDEFVKLGKPNRLMELFDEDLNPLFNVDFADRDIVSGAVEYIIPRPDLYALLLRQIPTEYIHMGKKVESYQEDSEGVTITCSDNTTYRGDILVGADGAYSNVREQLYSTLKAKASLPPSDEEPLTFNCVCLVGQTEVLDPEEFPGLKLHRSHFVSMIKSGSYKWTTFSSAKNTLCWFVIQILDEKKSKGGSSNSEWGPGAAEAMCNEVRDFKLHGGKDGKVLTMGDMIDRTPKGMISKVMLEEKLFDTWYGGRTVLIGDACHKLHPASGAGALSAIQDAVALANWICTLESSSMTDLETVFKEYRDERYPALQQAFATAQVFKSLGENTWRSTLNKALLRYMPHWLWVKTQIKMSQHRPQLSFLPWVEDKGSVPPAYQASLQKTLAIREQRAAAIAV
ncbi:hypothetical protein MVEG_08184 [Podila verticillata NRRL 6337]|nr:hypothetical protein MVEG_08184 [Podila verticillata NRRL 6337]